MKRVFQHPPKREGGRQYWRSLEEYADTAEFREWIGREFPAGAAEIEVDGVSRRGFLRLMGASMALAGLGMASCRRPESYIAPFSNSVEWNIPGKPLYYATAMPTRHGGLPLITTTHDGRPTKLDGNPLLPATGGRTDVFTQGSILTFWDPDRSASFLRDGGMVAAEEFTEFMRTLRGKLGDGGSLGILLDGAATPTRSRLIRELRAAYPGVTVAEYDPLDPGHASSAVAAAFGDGVRARPRPDRADVVFSLGADFLGPVDGTVADSLGFSARRRVNDTGDGMNRLYIVENRYSVTGGMADHRLRLKASAIASFAAGLAAELAEQTGDSGLAAVAEAAGAKTVSLDVDPKWITEAARDLAGAGPSALILADPGQPPAVHALALAMNQALGAVGTTVELLPDDHPGTATIGELAEKIRGGGIDVLLIAGGNPAYNAPADLDWPALQQSVQTVIRLGLFEDETSQLAQWHVPGTHFLEEWGDARACDGTLLAVQPMILPLYDGIPAINLLTLLATGELPADDPAPVRATFDRLVPDGGDEAWTAFLRNGFAADSAPDPVTRPARPEALAALIRESDGLAPVDGLEIVFTGDYKVGDGTYANNGWMQELPDPVTKLTWGNAVLMSPATAERLGVGSTDVLSDKKLKDPNAGSSIVTLTRDGREITAPVLVAPGHADDSLTIALGYGRPRAGEVGTGIGADAYRLRTSDAPLFAPVGLSSDGVTEHIPVTHGHWTMESRDPVREATLDAWRDDPTFAQVMGMDGHIPPDISIYKSPKLDAPEQWAMTIDLNTCTGCNACVIACQAENNIPIVGPEQVINQREMHWIRIDRYFSTVSEDDPDPEMVMQPLNCQHCENAPCETVCPVNATVHSEDGMNVMVYNRCIGTRYCANNCPYKVRRFNFFDYNKRDPLERVDTPFGETGNLYLGPLGKKGSPESVQMQRNPNVTVRMRGVMEKCTFCIQRVEEAKIKARVKAGGSPDLKIPTDSVRSACQQACPADAIVFGDEADPESEVARLRASDRGYTLLRYLNVRPRVTYLARLRNPNPAMPGAERIGMINHLGGHGHDAHGGAQGHAGHGGTPHGPGDQGGGPGAADATRPVTETTH